MSITFLWVVFLSLCWGVSFCYLSFASGGQGSGFLLVFGYVLSLVCYFFSSVTSLGWVACCSTWFSALILDSVVLVNVFVLVIFGFCNWG